MGRINHLRQAASYLKPGVYIRYYIENHIFSTAPFGDHIFSPYIYLQECKNKRIFDQFFLVFEQIVLINFHFFSPHPLPLHLFLLPVLIVYRYHWYHTYFLLISR